MRRNPPPTSCGVACAFQVITLQASADGPLGGPENTGGLLDGVVILLHTVSIPLLGGFRARSRGRRIEEKLNVEVFFALFRPMIKRRRDGD